MTHRNTISSGNLEKGIGIIMLIKSKDKQISHFGTMGKNSIPLSIFTWILHRTQSYSDGLKWTSQHNRLDDTEGEALILF